MEIIERLSDIEAEIKNVEYGYDTSIDVEMYLDYARDYIKKAIEDLKRMY